ncbi:hypothetical protein BDZ91DRAFT_154097 [Kalaharituber pfeilii]|nr:hypothetical protein BDZ91DRAFT_154097 [Kalaharituber pfeilii]
MTSFFFAHFSKFSPFVMGYVFSCSFHSYFLRPLDIHISFLFSRFLLLLLRREALFFSALIFSFLYFMNYIPRFVSHVLYYSCRITSITHAPLFEFPLPLPLLFQHIVHCSCVLRLRFVRLIDGCCSGVKALFLFFCLCFCKKRAKTIKLFKIDKRNDYPQ